MDNAGYLQELFGMSGQVAVILGGGGALGIALARGLARNGAKVIIASSRRESCDEAVAKLAQEGIETIGIPTNVTSRESLVALRDKALELTGQVDMLVNCAGANAGSSFLDVDEERWDSIMAVNLKGTMLACKVFIESMLKNKDGGAILNIGSVNSDRPLSRVFAYAASKAGVVNLTRNIAQEFATKGIRCNALCPGFFPAEQNRKILDDERVANIMHGTPMKRYGDPNELVGAAILLLAKNAGSFITGSEFYVDGGFTSSWF
ncbi:MAG: SDR family NAD(P)-dependent oxidoreductase [Thermoguttaceae bacterium]|jgi:NAD(P)-dependent dehydrogenase (short-subunit alcohol dehydrogenase family)